MHTSANGNRVYSFGAFTLDVRRGALRKNGAEIKLRPQSFGVLRYLVENSGRLVTRDELASAIWGEAVVTDGSLTQCLIEIRRALGDRSRQAIRTVPRRGFILELPVEWNGNSSAVTAPRIAPKWRWRYRIAALALACAVALIAWAVALRTPDAPASTAVSRSTVNPDSIAVLPFADMSPAGDHQYLSDGIAEEILNLLAQSSQLQVIARTSSFSFRDKEVDIATIAEKLHVATVLEGSVRTAGKRVRVTAQLVDAATSSHLWSETYDYELGDVLALEHEIAAATAAALEVAFVKLRQEDRGASVNPEAYEDYLQGRFFYNRRGAGDVERAVASYRNALAIDSTFARAWAGLAGAYMVQIFEGGQTRDDARSRWQGSVEQALLYGPGLAESQIRAAQFYFHAGKNETALDHFRRAQALDPDNALTLGAAAGNAALLGRMDQAVELQRRAVALDPLAFTAHSNLAFFLAGGGHFDAAATELSNALALSPGNAQKIAVQDGFLLIVRGRIDEAFVAIKRWPEGPDREQGLAMVYYALGRETDSAVALQRLAARPEARAMRRVAEVYAWRGDFDETFKWLERAREPSATETKALVNNQWLLDVRMSPFLVKLHGDARWDAYFAAPTD